MNENRFIPSLLSLTTGYYDRFLRQNYNHAYNNRFEPERDYNSNYCINNPAWNTTYPVERHVGLYESSNFHPGILNSELFCRRSQFESTLRNLPGRSTTERDQYCESRIANYRTLPKFRRCEQQINKKREIFTNTREATNKYYQRGNRHRNKRKPNRNSPKSIYNSPTIDRNIDGNRNNISGPPSIEKFAASPIINDRKIIEPDKSSDSSTKVVFEETKLINEPCSDTTILSMDLGTDDEEVKDSEQQNSFSQTSTKRKEREDKHDAKANLKEIHIKNTMTKDSETKNINTNSTKFYKCRKNETICSLETVDVTNSQSYSNENLSYLLPKYNTKNKKISGAEENKKRKYHNINQSNNTTKNNQRILPTTSKKLVSNRKKKLIPNKECGNVSKFDNSSGKRIKLLSPTVDSTRIQSNKKDLQKSEASVPHNSINNTVNGRISGLVQLSTLPIKDPRLNRNKTEEIHNDQNKTANQTYDNLLVDPRTNHKAYKISKIHPIELKIPDFSKESKTITTKPSNLRDHRYIRKPIRIRNRSSVCSESINNIRRFYKKPIVELMKFCCHVSIRRNECKYIFPRTPSDINVSLIDTRKSYLPGNDFEKKEQLQTNKINEIICCNFQYLSRKNIEEIKTSSVNVSLVDTETSCISTRNSEQVISQLWEQGEGNGKDQSQTFNRKDNSERIEPELENIHRSEYVISERIEPELENIRSEYVIAKPLVELGRHDSSRGNTEKIGLTITEDTTVSGINSAKILSKVHNTYYKKNDTFSNSNKLLKLGGGSLNSQQSHQDTKVASENMNNSGTTLKRDMADAPTNNKRMKIDSEKSPSNDRVQVPCSIFTDKPTETDVFNPLLGKTSSITKEISSKQKYQYDTTSVVKSTFDFSQIFEEPGISEKTHDLGQSSIVSSTPSKLYSIGNSKEVFRDKANDIVLTEELNIASGIEDSLGIPKDNEEKTHTEMLEDESAKTIERSATTILSIIDVQNSQHIPDSTKSDSISDSDISTNELLRSLEETIESMTSSDMILSSEDADNDSQKELFENQDLPTTNQNAADSQKELFENQDLPTTNQNAAESSMENSSSYARTDNLAKKSLSCENKVVEDDQESSKKQVEISIGERNGIETVTNVIGQERNNIDDSTNNFQGLRESEENSDIGSEEGNELMEDDDEDVLLLRVQVIKNPEVKKEQEDDSIMNLRVNLFSMQTEIKIEDSESSINKTPISPIPTVTSGQVSSVYHSSDGITRKSEQKISPSTEDHVPSVLSTNPLLKQLLDGKPTESSLSSEKGQLQTLIDRVVMDNISKDKQNVHSNGIQNSSIPTLLQSSNGTCFQVSYTSPSQSHLLSTDLKRTNCDTKTTGGISKTISISTMTMSHAPQTNVTTQNINSYPNPIILVSKTTTNNKDINVSTPLKGNATSSRQNMVQATDQINSSTVNTHPSLPYVNGNMSKSLTQYADIEKERHMPHMSNISGQSTVHRENEPTSQSKNVSDDMSRILTQYTAIETQRRMPQMSNNADKTTVHQENEPTSQSGNVSNDMSRSLSQYTAIEKECRMPQMSNIADQTIVHQENESTSQSRIGAKFALHAFKIVNTYILSKCRGQCLTNSLEFLNKFCCVENEIRNVNDAIVKMTDIFADILLENMQCLPVHITNSIFFVPLFMENLVGAMKNNKAKPFLSLYVWELVCLRSNEYEKNSTLKYFKTYLENDLKAHRNISGTPMSLGQYMTLKSQIVHYLSSLRIPKTKCGEETSYSSTNKQNANQYAAPESIPNRPNYTQMGINNLLESTTILNNKANGTKSAISIPGNTSIIGHQGVQPRSGHLQNNLSHQHQYRTIGNTTSMVSNMQHLPANVAGNRKRIADVPTASSNMNHRFDSSCNPTSQNDETWYIPKKKPYNAETNHSNALISNVKQSVMYPNPNFCTTEQSRTPEYIMNHMRQSSGFPTSFPRLMINNFSPHIYGGELNMYNMTAATGVPITTSKIQPHNFPNQALGDDINGNVTRSGAGGLTTSSRMTANNLTIPTMNRNITSLGLSTSSRIIPTNPFQNQIYAELNEGMLQSASTTLKKNLKRASSNAPNQKTAINTARNVKEKDFAVDREHNGNAVTPETVTSSRIIQKNLLEYGGVPNVESFPPSVSYPKSTSGIAANPTQNEKHIPETLSITSNILTPNTALNSLEAKMTGKQLSEPPSERILSSGSPQREPIPYPTPPISNGNAASENIDDMQSTNPSTDWNSSNESTTSLPSPHLENSEVKPFSSSPLQSMIFESQHSISLKSDPDDIIDLTWAEDDEIKLEPSNDGYALTLDERTESLLILHNRKCLCGEDAIYLCACNTVMYCSQECQFKDWENHQRVCPAGLSP